MSTALRIGAFALIFGGIGLFSSAGCVAEGEPEASDMEEGRGAEGAPIAEGELPIRTGVFYYIRAKHSDKCLHQHGGTFGNGDRITQWECVDQYNVQWEFERTDDPGYYFIKARHSGKCAHQHGGTYGNGGRITQWDCVDQGNVKWRLIHVGRGYYHIKAQHSGKCMHVHGASWENGARITQWDCINQPNVLWAFDLVGD